MREATVELENMLSYCKAIFNAESEEEIEQIKQELLENLRANGTDEQVVSDYEMYLEQIVDRFESGELTFDENGMLVRNEEFVQESAQVQAPEPVESGNFSTTAAGVALGLVASTIVVTVKLRKNFSKKQKQKRL